MKGIKIQCIGEVAFESYFQPEEGYRCDVPTDALGIPFLPLFEILKRDLPSFSSFSGVELGFARPDGYLEILQSAGKICAQIPNGKSRIKMFYTREHFDTETGIRLRSLRSGLTFFAPLHVRDEDLERLERELKLLTHIGLRAKGISGEVRCRVCEMRQGRANPRPFPEGLEWATGQRGAFEIVGCYTDICMDYANRFGWAGDGPVTRCLKMGSVLRIRTKDGKAANISPILHSFIGESTRDGYGEIMAWPAANVYYRVTKELMPGKYDIVPETRVRDLHLGARWVHAELTELLKRKAAALGLLDSADPEERAQAQTPFELLEELRDAYDPEIEMKVLENCYREGLRTNAGNREAADAWYND